MFLQRNRTLKIILVLLSLLLLSGCAPHQAPVIEPSLAQEEVLEDQEGASLISSFEILHADNADIFAYVHGEHWHGALPFIQEGDTLAIDIRVETSSGEIVYPDGTDLSLGVQVGDGAADIFTIDSFDDRLHIQGNQAGETHIYFYIEQAGEVVFKTPSIQVIVIEKGANVEPVAVPDVYSYDLIDRSQGRVTADFHCSKWYGSIPSVQRGKYVSIGAVIKDTQGHIIVLDGQPFSAAARVADQGNAGVVSFNFHRDHLYIIGESTGDTLLVFMLLADDKPVFETPPIPVKVVE